jgi:hypothetical protein
MKLRSRALTALTMSLAAAPALADVYVVYTGTVSSGYDQTGLFGVGTDLSGDSYTATFVFDPTKGVVYSSSSYNYAFGGDVNSNASPALYGSVTINGITQAIGVPSYFGSIAGYNDGSKSYQAHDAEFSSNDGNIYNYNYSNDSIDSSTSTIPASIIAPFSYIINQSTDYSTGYFQFYSAGINDGALYQNTYGYLIPLTVTASSTPEPSSWIMILIGTAALSFVYYRPRLVA